MLPDRRCQNEVPRRRDDANMRLVKNLFGKKKNTPPAILSEPAQGAKPELMPQAWLLELFKRHGLVSTVHDEWVLGGTDATVSIPVVSVSQNDGVTLKAVALAAPRYGSRTKPGLASSGFSTDPTRLSGADAAGRPLLYAPNPFVDGSSVSHWDVSAFPNLLMEPNINLDLTTSLVPPKDLTKPLLADLGW